MRKLDKNLNLQQVLLKIEKNEKKYRRLFKENKSNLVLKKKKFDKVIALENAPFSVACLIVEILRFYHQNNTCVIYGCLGIDTTDYKDKKVLVLRFDEVKQDCISRGVTLTGQYEFNLSSYPNQDNKLYNFLKSTHFCDFVNYVEGKILGKMYFYSEQTLEKQMIEIAQITGEFDKQNNVITRLFSVSYCAPVRNDDGLLTLYKDVQIDNGDDNFSSNGANLLIENEGVLIRINKTNYLDRLCEYVKRFTEA